MLMLFLTCITATTDGSTKLEKAEIYDYDLGLRARPMGTVFEDRKERKY
jgi:hypothetical protein